RTAVAGSATGRRRTTPRGCRRSRSGGPSTAFPAGRWPGGTPRSDPTGHRTARIAVSPSHPLGVGNRASPSWRDSAVSRFTGHDLVVFFAGAFPDRGLSGRGIPGGDTLGVEKLLAELVVPAAGGRLVGAEGDALASEIDAELVGRLVVLQLGDGALAAGDRLGPPPVYGGFTTPRFPPGVPPGLLLVAPYPRPPPPAQPPPGASSPPPPAAL